MQQNNSIVYNKEQQVENKDDGITRRRQLFLTQQEFQQIHEKEPSLSLSSPSFSCTHSQVEGEIQVENLHQQKRSYTQPRQIQFQEQQQQLQSNSHSRNDQYSERKSCQSKQTFKEKYSYKVFNKANLIKKFVAILLNKLSGRRFLNMQEQHFQLIQDYCYFQVKSKNIAKSKNDEDDSENAGTNKNIYELPSQLQQQPTQNKCSIKVFQPNKLSLMIWKGILCLFYLLQFIIFPLQFAFKIRIEDNSVLSFLLYQASVFIFIIEILISMNTGIYYEGTITLDRIIICKIYFKYKFWVDALSLATIFINDSLIWILLIFLLRYWQILNIFNKFDEQIQLQQRFPTIYQLFKLLFLILSVAHYTGSGFFYVSIYDLKENNNVETWVKKNGLFEKMIFEQYVNSLYFSIITMITIGFGDITPISVNEKLYVIIVCLISCCIFAFAVNTIGQIFQDISHRESDFKQKKFHLTTYLNMRNIAKKVQIKVLKYLEYINNQEKERIFTQQGEAILQQLSQSIRDEVFIDFYMRLLNQSSLFTLNFSSNFLKQLSLQMKEVILGPTDILFRQGDYDGKLIYINRGQMEMYSTQGYGDKTKSVGLLKERYCMMRDEIMFQDKYFEEQCYLCSKDNHQIINCPFIHYHPSKLRVFQIYNYSQNQVRKVFERFKKIKFHTISQNSRINLLLRKKRLSLLQVNFQQEEDQNILEPESFNDIEFFLNIPKVVIEDGEIYEQSEDSELSDTDIQKMLIEEQLFQDSKNNKLLPIQEQSSQREDEESGHKSNSKSIDNLSKQSFQDFNNNSRNKHSLTCNDDLLNLLEHQQSENSLSQTKMNANQNEIQQQQQQQETNHTILQNSSQKEVILQKSPILQEANGSQQTIFSTQQIQLENLQQQSQLYEEKQKNPFKRLKSKRSISQKQNEDQYQKEISLSSQQLLVQPQSITQQAIPSKKKYTIKRTKTTEQLQDYQDSELLKNNTEQAYKSYQQSTSLKKRTVKIRRTLVRGMNQIPDVNTSPILQPANQNFQGQNQLLVQNIQDQKKKSSDALIQFQGPGGPLFTVFDRLQEYTLYYPNNNITHILKILKKKLYDTYKSKLQKFSSKKTFGQRQSAMQRSSLTQQRKKSEFLQNQQNQSRPIFSIIQ